jgi:hypothetical protein
LKAVRTLWLDSAFLKKEPCGVEVDDDGDLWDRDGGEA